MPLRKLSRRGFLNLSGASVASVAFVACRRFWSGSDPSDDGTPELDGVEVRFATDWVEGARGATMDAALDIWSDQNPEVAISLESIDGDYFENLQRQFSSETIADVILFEGVLGAEFIDEGLIADLSPTLDALGIDFATWRPGPVDIFLQSGKVYAIPFQLTPALWFYNKTLFEEKGVALPDGTWDWTQTLEGAKQLTDAPHTYGMWTDVDMFHQYGALGLANSDHHWVNENYTETLIGEEDFAASIRWFISTVQEHHVSPLLSEEDDLLTDDASNLFATGKIGMTTGNAGSIGAYIQDIGDRFEWDVMPTPKGPDSELSRKVHIIPEVDGARRVEKVRKGGSRKKNVG
ncbi:extracellular solute-binding protein [Chloroflexi bacterium TSY]|nr:extracellular solute-binding protein [Chloroflexi bacterium TSY]